MKRSHIFIAIATIVLTLIACGQKKNQHEFEMVEVQDSSRDSTVYGVCSDGTSMHTLQIITDSGDTLSLSTLPAEERGRIFGGFSIGDHMAVLMDHQRTKTTVIVNLTTLLGEWVMPNPMDGTSEMGFSIRDGGIVESINQGSIIYETWRIVNGDLEMMSIREGGANFEEVERYQLLYLSADSLSFANSEETFEYSRPHPQEDYSDLDVELDDEAEEDMIM